MGRLVYLDNAATTYPKPQCVIEAVRTAMLYCGGNPGRGSHRLSTKAAELIYDTRVKTAGLFNADPERVVFTMNATQALNYSIKGLATRGCHILIDNLCHNASFRPVHALSTEGITYDFYDATGSDDAVMISLASKLKPNTRLVVATHQSNLIPNKLPLHRMGELCRRRGISFIVDASQSAGHTTIDVDDMGITALCLPGHKGLYGPMGVGLLVLGEDADIRTVIEGGSGTNSKDTAMPHELPDRLEAGTLPLSAIAGLGAGIDYVRRIGVENIGAREENLMSRLLSRLTQLDRVKICSDKLGSTLAFNIDGISPTAVGEYLDSQGICVRAGFHCAPIAHKTLGTYEEGSVRIGLSYHNTPEEIDYTARAITNLCKMSQYP